MKKVMLILIMFLVSISNGMVVENGATSVITYFVFRDQTAGTIDTGVTIGNMEMYYVEDQAAQSADVFVGAHGAATDAYTTGECYHVGHGVYRVDWPNAAFDGGIGKRVQLIVVDGDAGAFTEIMEVELSPPVDVITVAGTSQTGNDNGADINVILTNTDAFNTVGEYATAIWGASVSSYDVEDTFGNMLNDVFVEKATVYYLDTLDEDTTTFDWNGTTIGTATTTGTVNALAANIVNASAVADNTIDAGAIAPNAITNSELASSAVTEIWAIVMSDLAATPAFNASVLDAINYIFEYWRNTMTTTSSGATGEIALMKDDGVTKFTESNIGDDGTTFTRGEFGAVD